MSRIFLSAPDVGDREAEYVLDALRSGWVAPLGPHVDAFEREMADRIGVAHAVALSSGTAALHLGLLTLGVGPDDVVITSTLTFAATANAICYVGARPVFLDSDPATGNMDPGLLAEAVAELRSEGLSIGAILPVDLLGKAADYSAIESIAASAGIPVLADAAESLGARHDGRPAGSFGAAAALSFNGNKIMTTSGGGMFLSSDEGLASRVRYLATQARQPVPHYEHTDVGYNYRLSNVLAALGRAQLERLDAMIARRAEIRGRYREIFSGVDGIEIFGGANDSNDNFWLTAILVDEHRVGWGPAALNAALSALDIESRPVWKPMHRQPVFQAERAFVTGVADSLFDRGLTLPSGSVLDGADLDRVCDAITSFLERQ